MNEGKEELERSMHSKEAAALLKNRGKLTELMKAPETARLMDLLERTSGGNLKSAAKAATKGDPTKLMELMKEVMSAQEGAKAVQDLKKKLP